MVMEIMEFAKSYARGALATSRTVAKIYQFHWPLRVYVGWIFEDSKTAREAARYFKAFFRVRKEWRRVNGRELPAVFVDFEDWITFYSMRGNQLHPLDTIALRYLKKGTNMGRAFKKLARDLAEFFKECGREIERGVEDV